MKLTIQPKRIDPKNTEGTRKGKGFVNLIVLIHLKQHSFQVILDHEIINYHG